MCGGLFVATVPTTAAGGSLDRTSGDASDVNVPENTWPGIGVGTEPVADGTITMCVSAPSTESFNRAAGAPMSVPSLRCFACVS